MAIELATFEQIATILTQLGTNYSNLFTDYFNIFYSNEPMDVTLQYYDEAGALQTIIIPNRAKDRAYILNGEGAPEGSVSGQAGALYQDLLNGNVYIKQVSASDVNGWEKIISAEDLSEFISKGSGSPEGIVSKSKGTLYIDMTNSVLYVKKSVTGTEGWEAITVDTSNLANVDLSNLSSLGEMHFANVDLSNLSTVGQTVLEDKVNKAGDTMTGGLTISSNDTQVKIIHPTEVAGTTPSSEQATGVRFYDKNETLLGYVQNTYSANGSRVTMLNCRNADGTENSNIVIGYYSNGNVYTSAPTPPSTSNDNNIATTKWVKAQGYSALTYTPVNKAGDTMTGSLSVRNGGVINVFGEGDPRINIVSDIEVAGTIPSSTINKALVFRDKNNTWLGCCNQVYDTNGLRYTRIASYNGDGSSPAADIRVGYDANNNVFTFAPNPSSTSNNNNIATTSFVRKWAYGNYVQKNLDIISSNTSVNGSTNITYNIGVNGYLPSDYTTYKYEVLTTAEGMSGEAVADYMNIVLYSDIITGLDCAKAKCVVSGRNDLCSWSGWIPISTSGRLYLARNSNWTGYVSRLTLRGYRRIH